MLTSVSFALIFAIISIALVGYWYLYVFPTPWDFRNAAKR
jgi:Flp pilus assembly pilin Flp